jgi:hypothetical protein
MSLRRAWRRVEKQTKRSVRDIDDGIHSVVGGILDPIVDVFEGVGDEITNLFGELTGSNAMRDQLRMAEARMEREEEERERMREEAQRMRQRRDLQASERAGGLRRSEGFGGGMMGIGGDLESSNLLGL